MSSIIKDDDYEDLGNHAIGAMGETGLFNLAQVCSFVSFFLFRPIVVSFGPSFFFFLQGVVMMKGLMDCYASHEMVVSRLREKVEVREMELWELTVWKEVQVNKLDLTRQLLEELKAQVMALKKLLKDKKGEISEAKGLLCQAKEDDVVREYCDFDTLLKELGGSFADGFNNCFRQVKASLLNLDLSHISIDAQAQTPT